jgi:hypothetical protein
MKLKIFGAFTFDPTTKTLSPLFPMDGDNFFCNNQDWKNYKQWNSALLKM